MKYDLLLTETGDLSFITSNTKFKNEMLEFNFHIAQTDSLRLNFNIIGTNDNMEFPNKQPEDLNRMFSDSLQLSFYTYTPSFDKMSRTVRNRDYIQQSIKLRLSTEINTVLHNEKLGSNLHEYIHSNLETSRLLSNIVQQVKSSIVDILPSCEVSAYIINSDYLNYHDSIKIVIVNNEEVYYYYI
jgi:phage baseplate assembly protein W